MFQPSQSSSGPPRKQIQELFSLSPMWDSKCRPDIYTIIIIIIIINIKAWTL